jgi:DNA-binding NarL/FixJ family response regulator
LGAEFEAPTIWRPPFWLLETIEIAWHRIRLGAQNGHAPRIGHRPRPDKNLQHRAIRSHPLPASRLALATLKPHDGRVPAKSKATDKGGGGTGAGQTITVSIVDDDAGLRESISQFLRTARGFCCLNAYASAAEALAALPSAPADVVLMDINMAGVDGIECTRRLKTVLPDAHILMLTVYEDTERIFKALAAGASGYLLKRMNPATLLEAIREVHGGGSPMSGPIARKVVQFFQQGPPPRTEAEALSGREQQVLHLLSQGYAYKQIGDELGVSMDTTRTYIRRIYEKLHVHSRTEAVMRFVGGKNSPRE